MKRQCRRKPTRRDLLIVIGRLQNFIGDIVIAAGDRNPNRAHDIDRTTRSAHLLCVDARSYDPPLTASGPWSEVGERIADAAARLAYSPASPRVCRAEPPDLGKKKKQHDQGDEAICDVHERRGAGDRAEDQSPSSTCERNEVEGPHG